MEYGTVDGLRSGPKRMIKSRTKWIDGRVIRWETVRVNPERKQRKGGERNGCKRVWSYCRGWWEGVEALMEVRVGVNRMYIRDRDINRNVFSCFFRFIYFFPLMFGVMEWIASELLITHMSQLPHSGYCYYYCRVSLPLALTLHIYSWFLLVVLFS